MGKTRSSLRSRYAKAAYASGGILLGALVTAAIKSHEHKQLQSQLHDRTADLTAERIDRSAANQARQTEIANLQAMIQAQAKNLRDAESSGSIRNSHLTRAHADLGRARRELASLVSERNTLLKTSGDRELLFSSLEQELAGERSARADNSRVHAETIQKRRNNLNRMKQELAGLVKSSADRDSLLSSLEQELADERAARANDSRETVHRRNMNGLRRTVREYTRQRNVSDTVLKATTDLRPSSFLFLKTCIDFTAGATGMLEIHPGGGVSVDGKAMTGFTQATDEAPTDAAVMVDVTTAGLFSRSATQVILPRATDVQAVTLALKDLLASLQGCSDQDLAFIRHIASALATGKADMGQIRALRKGLSQQGRTVFNSFPQLMCVPFLRADRTMRYDSCAVFDLHGRGTTWMWLAGTQAAQEDVNEQTANARGGLTFMYLATGGDPAKFSRPLPARKF